MNSHKRYKNKTYARRRGWMRECLRQGMVGQLEIRHASTREQKLQREAAVTNTFLETPNEGTFADLFQTFRPQLIAFFRSRGCNLDLAEDLGQEVMLTVYRKAQQVRDRPLFRAWLFKVARNALSRHYGKRTREVETVNLTDVHDRVATSTPKPAGAPAFEFLHWMAFLDSRESEVMKLRFIEEWEYHEIAAAKDIPIGTVQWRVFNAKKKLAPHLTANTNIVRKAA